MTTTTQISSDASNKLATTKYVHDITDEKQDSLTTEQLAAVNSGITAERLENIETTLDNKANTATTYTKTEVDTALSGKQPTLTTAQLAAVNSGITSADVEQIETNKNNILSLYNQNGKTFNLFDINRPIDVAYHATAVVANNAITIGTVSGDWAYVGIKALNLPAGSYRVSGKISNLVTGTAGTTRIVVSQYSSASQGSLTYINITQNGDFSGNFSWTGGDVYLLFYVNNSSSSSANYTYTASDLQIISTSAYNAGFTEYQPYTLSNATITPALKECVDNGVKNLLDTSQVTVGNITFTPNSSTGYVTASPNSSDSRTWGYANCQYKVYLKPDNYVFVLDIDTATTTSGSGFMVYSEVGTTMQALTSITNKTGRITCEINIRTAQTYGFQIKQYGASIRYMLCKKSLYDADPTYQPYVMSNVGLMEKVKPLSFKQVYADASTAAKEHNYQLRLTDFKVAGCGTYLVMVVPWGYTPTPSLYAISYSGGNVNYSVVNKIFGADISFAMDSENPTHLANNTITFTASGKVTIYTI